jgi:hypothetical protein
MTIQAPHNEWNELDAAMRSEAELRRIMTQGPDKVSSRELELARRDAMKAMVVGLPDPRDVAAYLETADPEAAAALKGAWQSHRAPYFGAWRVMDDASTPVLRAMGLVGWIGTERNMGCCVGGFGLQVRKVMLFDANSKEGDA